MLCVTCVYLRDITNTIFVILHLNVSHLSVCSSFHLAALQVRYSLVLFVCGNITDVAVFRGFRWQHRKRDLLYLRQHYVASSYCDVAIHETVNLMYIRQHLQNIVCTAVWFYNEYLCVSAMNQLYSLPRQGGEVQIEMGNCNGWFWLWWTTLISDSLMQVQFWISVTVDICAIPIMWFKTLCLVLVWMGIINHVLHFPASTDSETTI